MENNFLTDAELSATVADINSVNSQIKLVKEIQSQFQSGSMSRVDYMSNPDGWNYVLGVETGNGFQIGKRNQSNDDQSNVLFQVVRNNDNTCSIQLKNLGALGVLLKSDGTAQKIGGGSFSAISDERMKDNIQPFEDGLNKILAINPKTFNYIAIANTPTEFYPPSICDKTNYGVIAQELETVAPEMVTTGEDGYKSVDLSNLCLLLVNAVKEQNQMILDLTARVEALETPQA